MIQSQFEYISELSWGWYRSNMLGWAIKTLREVQDAPQWVKDCLASDTIVCPSMDDEVFELAHSDDIEKILRESQKRNLEVNYTKELTEFFEARRDNDEYEMIDALCDMVIIAMNAGAILGDERSEWFYNNLINPIKYAKPYILGLLYEIRRKGYDPYLCLLETIKELRTRTGSWNEKEGKWIKDVGAYTFEEADKIASNYDAENGRELYEDNTEFWRWQLHIKGEYCSFKVKKWYRAEYEKCKVEGK